MMAHFKEGEPYNTVTLSFFCNLLLEFWSSIVKKSSIANSQN